MLTDDEREALFKVVDDVVERIIADRERVARAEALRDKAPTSPLPPSVISALVHERADQEEDQ